jgi:hypothetical protein
MVVLTPLTTVYALMTLATMIPIVFTVGLMDQVYPLLCFFLS